MINKRFIYSACLAGTSTITAMAAKSDQPNVVIIYGDDVGYGDVGVYGSKLIPTPNIDKLAKNGLVFTDAHCSAATSTPSRYSMLTGRHAFRKHISILPGDAKMAIPTDVMTLPKLFKKAGYTTGVIGKWHLGLGDGKTPIDWNKDVKPGPLEIGFDSSFLLPATNDRVPCVYLRGHKVENLDEKDPITVSYRSPLSGKHSDGREVTTYPNGRKNREAMTFYQSSHGHNSSVINGIGRIGYMQGGKSALWNDEMMADVLMDETRKFIDKNKKKPFFLYFASQDIHVPRVPHPRFRGKTKLSYRGDAMVQFDWTTGEIMKELEKHGLTENTIVIFSSDNGPVYDDGYKDGCTVRTSSKDVDRGHDGSGPYRGGKYQIAEGGTRIPFIVRWPKGIKPGTSKALVSQIDFMASFASFLNIDLPANEAIDSKDSMDAILGKNKVGSNFILEEAGARLAIRKGPWKYLPAKKVRAPKKNKKSKKPQKPGKPMLYNLDNDIQEQNNVADKFPEIVKEMEKLMDKIKQNDGIKNI